MSAYCTQSDVYRWIPRGSVQNPARLISSIATATEIITLDGHGLETDDELLFRADAGGSLPSPIVAGTSYYAIRLTDSTFSVAASAGGAAINLTTAGSNVVVIAPLPWDAWIEEASNEVECTMPAHAVPLTAPYPAVVRAYTAGLVAEKALAFCGVQSLGVTERLKITRSELKEWRKKGLPIRGGVVPASSNLAISSGATDTDSRGWTGSGEGYLP